MKRILSVIISMCFMIASFNLPVYAKDKDLEPTEDYETYNMTIKELNVWCAKNLFEFSNGEYPFKFLVDEDSTTYLLPLNEQVSLVAEVNEESEDEYIDLLGVAVLDFSEYRKMDEEEKVFVPVVISIMEHFNCKDTHKTFDNMLGMSEQCHNEDSSSFGVYVENHTEFMYRSVMSDSSLLLYFTSRPSKYSNNKKFKTSDLYEVYTDTFCS